MSYNDNNLYKKTREQEMAQCSVLSYKEIIDQLAKEDAAQKNKSLVEPQLLKMKRADLKERPYLAEAYKFEERLFQFSIDYFPGYDFPKTKEAAKKQLEKIFNKFIPKVFDTSKYYLFLENKPEFSIQGGSEETLLSEEKCKEIHSFFAKKYAALNKNKPVYKIDLVPEVIDGSFVIPLQYHEYRYLLGFLALEQVVPSKEMFEKAKLLNQAFWDTLRDTFELKFK